MCDKTTQFSDLYYFVARHTEFVIKLGGQRANRSFPEPYSKCTRILSSILISYSHKRPGVQSGLFYSELPNTILGARFSVS
jgi:hypothetical protein